MKLTQIPYTKHTGVEEEGENLTLLPHQDIQNHLGGIHAGAIFTLAETQSGHYLQRYFPKHQDRVMAMVQDASIKYKLPATQKLYATATIVYEALEKFQLRFERKGRGSITIDVEVKEEDRLIATASFLWYVQRV